jgi:hypothetical protein
VIAAAAELDTVCLEHLPTARHGIRELASMCGAEGVRQITAIGADEPNRPDASRCGSRANVIWPARGGRPRPLGTTSGAIM